MEVLTIAVDNISLGTITLGNMVETHSPSLFSSHIEMSLISVKAINRDLEYKERTTGERRTRECKTWENMGCEIYLKNYF